MAQLLRERRFEDLDLENVAEEIESLGKEQVHALQSQLRRLLKHLLKHQFQPAKRTGSWRGSMASARIEIEGNLEVNPSLKPRIENLMQRAYLAAVKEAMAETGLPNKTFPTACPWTFEQAMQDDFFPE